LRFLTRVFHAEVKFYNLNGVSYENTGKIGPLTTLSMAGGAPINIQGSMMGTMAEMNSIVLEPVWLEGTLLQGPALSSKFFPI